MEDEFATTSIEIKYGHEIKDGDFFTNADGEIFYFETKIGAVQSVGFLKQIIDKIKEVFHGLRSNF